MKKIFIPFLLMFLLNNAQANQREEHLSNSVITAMRSQIDKPYGSVPTHMKIDAANWIAKALPYTGKIPSDYRRAFLELVYYEATRAAVDPWLALSVISIESNFQRYATSSVGAQGYMQVMPFWVRAIGNKGQNLYDPATNIRYGCTILRHYLMIEKGNVTRALARYNGSLGKTEYPEMIFRHWQKFNKESFVAYNP